MKNIPKTLKRIRQAEAELSYATPARAAKLASEIVGQVLEFRSCGNSQRRKSKLFVVRPTANGANVFTHISFLLLRIIER
jgi:hypothetical protein